MDSISMSNTSQQQLDSFFPADGESELFEETLASFTDESKDSSAKSAPVSPCRNESRRENMLFILTVPTELEELRMRFERGAMRTSTPTNLRMSSLGDSQRTLSQYSNSKSASVSRSIPRCSPSIDNEQVPLKASKKSADLRVGFDFQDGQRYFNSATGSRRDLNAKEDKSSKSKYNSNDLRLPRDTPMEHVLQAMLRSLQIKNAVWTRDVEGKVLQVMFPVEFEHTYERLLDILYEWGIGDRMNSSISVLNCMASKYYEEPAELEQQRKKFKSQSAWKRFTDSVRCRLSVINVVNEIRREATLSFDFCVLVISAAIQAGLGLITNSYIFLISSMLISPLMGPILAAVFGTTIKDTKLCRKGTRNELVGLALSIAVGFVFGVCVCIVANCFGSGASVSAEMLARSELRTLALGVLTAITSGIAVTVAILDGNVGSLIGVAISASILPPAVNSGILWSYACLSAFDTTRFGNVIETAYFAKHPAIELFILGSLSICLTLINIFCIYGMGVTMLKVKEIAPVVARQDRLFWQRDIKMARKMQKTGYAVDRAVLDEFYSLPQSDQDALGIDSRTLRNLNANDELVHQTWPQIGTLTENFIDDPFNDNYETVYNLNRLFTTINRTPPQRRRSHTLGTKLDPLVGRRSYRTVTEIFAKPMVATASSTPTENIDDDLQNTEGSFGSNLLTSTSATECNQEQHHHHHHKRYNRFTVCPVPLHTDQISLDARAEDLPESTV